MFCTPWCNSYCTVKCVAPIHISIMPTITLKEYNSQSSRTYHHNDALITGRGNHYKYWDCCTRAYRKLGTSWWTDFVWLVMTTLRWLSLELNSFWHIHLSYFILPQTCFLVRMQKCALLLIRKHTEWGGLDNTGCSSRGIKEKKN